MMDVRDYKTIASTVSELRPLIDSEVWWKLVIDFCEWLEKDNQRFSREKFIDACEYRKETNGS